MAHPPAKKLAKELSALEKNGFAFVPYDDIKFRDAQHERYLDSLGRGGYGAAFILERYVRENWTRFFDVVAYEESPDEWQDYAILRRR